MDTDAIRRAWPQVLGRIFGMRRGTWTFVSQHAKVMAYDGKTLTLGISTAGLTNAFRAGNHADIVRQALIDELGVDAVVDGVHVADAGGPAVVAPPAGAVRPAPERRPTPGRPPRAVGHSSTTRVGAVFLHRLRTGPRALRRRRARTVPTRSHLTPTAGPPLKQPVARPLRSPRPRVRGRCVSRSTRPGEGLPTPQGAELLIRSLHRRDAAVSEDDEDIELSGDVGRSVVEKVLGGQVISESED